METSLPWRGVRAENLTINSSAHEGAEGFPDSSVGKESTCNVGDLGLTLGWEDFLEKRMAIHSSILAWRIPWTV